MLSTTQFLINANKIAKKYPRGAEYMASIRQALDASRTMTPNQRYDQIQRALVGGLVTQAVHDTSNLQQLSRVWHQYQQWHRKHANATYKNTVRGTAKLTNLPHHVFQNKIGRHLSNENSVMMRLAFQKNNPATNSVKNRRSQRQVELAALAKLGAQLVRGGRDTAQQMLAQLRLPGFKAQREPFANEEKIQYRVFSPNFVGYYYNYVAGGIHKESEFTITTKQYDEATRQIMEAQRVASQLRQQGQMERAEHMLALARASEEELQESYVQMKRTGALQRIRVTSKVWLPEWRNIVRAAAKRP